MLRKFVYNGFVLLFVACMSIAPLYAEDEKELEKRAELVSKLLVSCRAIIAEHQDLFNDPEKGDKGFTGDLYVSQLKKHFKDATGVEVSEDDANSADQTEKIWGHYLYHQRP